MKKIRAKIWFLLIRIADRISPESAFRWTGLTWRFAGEGKDTHIELLDWNHPEKGSGVPIWYYGPDYEKRWPPHGK